MSLVELVGIEGFGNLPDAAVLIKLVPLNLRRSATDSILASR
jgi:hypothetical protein